MDSFGLGLILSFTDRASAGMQRATQTFEQMGGMASSMPSQTDGAFDSIQALSLAGMSLSQVGDEVADVGAGIVSTYANAAKSVIDTGNDMLGYRMQINALFGENNSEKVISGIKSYAQTSVFQMTDIMNAVTMMKAVGIDAMKNVTATQGTFKGHKEKLMDYASDLGAMVPNMHNAYGTGASAAMGAIKEYVSEGNAMTLKRGAGMDITSILGEKKGATQAERMTQVANMISKLDIAGYTKELAGTPQQILSNLSDYFYNFKSDIADSGVYEKYTKILENISGVVSKLFDTSDKESVKRYTALVNICGTVLNNIMKPISALINLGLKAVMVIADLGEKHPKLISAFLTMGAVLGAVLLVGGKLMSLSGGMMMFLSSVAYMKTAGTTISGVFRMVGSSAGKAALKFLPFIAIGFLLYEAWKHNIFGLRDIIDGFVAMVTPIAKAINDTVGRAIKYVIGKVRDLHKAFVDGKHPAFTKFIEGLGGALKLLGPVIIATISYMALLRLSNALTAGSFKKLAIVEGVQKMMFALRNSYIANAVGSFFLDIANVGLRASFSALWTTLKANPFVLVTSIIIGVVSAIAMCHGHLGKLKDKFVNAFKNIKETMSNVGKSISHWFSNLLKNAPDISKHMVKNMDNFSKNFSKKLDKFSKTFPKKVDKFSKKFPIIINGFAKSLEKGIPKVVSAISKNGPAIMKAIGMIALTLVKCGFIIIKAIVLGIIHSLPALGRAGLRIIKALGRAILSGVGALGRAGVRLMTALWHGISRRVGWLGKKVLNFAKSIPKWIWSGIKGIAKIGGDIVRGLWEGITNKVSWIADKIKSFGKSVKDAFCDFFGINSPSTLMRDEVGFYIGEGVVAGFNKSDPMNQIQSGLGTVNADVNVSAKSKQTGIVPQRKKTTLQSRKAGNSTDTRSTGKVGDRYDYSVHFESGSITLVAKNSTDKELKKIADKLMKIIERKQELKNRATRNTSYATV